MLNVVEFVSRVTQRLRQLRVTDSELALRGGPTGATGLAPTGKSGHGFLECSSLDPQGRRKRRNAGMEAWCSSG